MPAEPKPLTEPAPTSAGPTVASALEQLRAEQERRTTRERHGEGELVRLSGVPRSATGCLLPDGARTRARCLTMDDGRTDASRVWTRPVVAGSALRRRGRLRIEPGTALHFEDEPKADLLPKAPHPAAPASLEADMAASARLRMLALDSDLFARLLYAGLCNTVWRHTASSGDWHISWRGAGRVVASLRSQGDYMDWYCSGGEGTVDEQVLRELQALGWALWGADDDGMDEDV